MKLSWWITAVGVVILGAIVFVSCANNDIKGEATVDNEVKIPPIDMNRPDVTATATFALG
jgi:PBP1b-binding outer membrane lipoprotein LpoB